MILVVIAVLIILFIAYLAKEFSRQQSLATKKQELASAKMEGDLLEMDKEIEQERARQRALLEDIKHLKKDNKI